MNRDSVGECTLGRQDDWLKKPRERRQLPIWKLATRLNFRSGSGGDIAGMGRSGSAMSVHSCSIACVQPFVVGISMVVSSVDGVP